MDITKVVSIFYAPKTIYLLKKANNNMGKYLHLYETENAFNAAYNSNVGDVTGFTAVLSNGPQDFFYGGEEDSHYIWTIPGGYVGAQLWTYTRNPQVGQWSRVDGTGAYSPGEEEGVEITQIRTGLSDAYHEPWVSYTLEEGTPYPEITAFTWSLDTYYDLDLSGEFKYIGDYYMPGTNPETRESTYDTTLIYYYYPIWSNGKSYVYPGDSDWNPVRNVMVAQKIFSVNFDAQHPGFLDNGVGGVEGSYAEKLAKAIEPKQVAYNKNENAIYLTWDGVSMTKLREGTQNEAEYPAYIVDQAKSKGDVKRARVYINDELAYTLSDCDNSHTVRSLGSYTDYIVFGYDTNGNRTCRYSWSIRLI